MTHLTEEMKEEMLLVGQAMGREIGKNIAGGLKGKQKPESYSDINPYEADIGDWEYLIRNYFQPQAKDDKGTWDEWFGMYFTAPPQGRGIAQDSDKNGPVFRGWLDVGYLMPVFVSIFDHFSNAGSGDVSKMEKEFNKHMGKDLGQVNVWSLTGAWPQYQAEHGHEGHDQQGMVNEDSGVGPQVGPRYELQAATMQAAIRDLARGQLSSYLDRTARAEYAEAGVDFIDEAVAPEQTEGVFE